MPRNQSHRRREVLFEFQRFGPHSVRVSAIDGMTGIEITMVGDLRYGEEMLKRLAMRKLKYVMDKKRRKDGPPDKLYI